MHLGRRRRERTHPDEPGQERRRLGRRRRGRGEETWQLRLYLKLFVLLLAIAYLVAFVIENHRETTIHFVFSTTRVSLIWLILLSLALGILGGVLLSQLYRRS